MIANDIIQVSTWEPCNCLDRLKTANSNSKHRVQVDMFNEVATSAPPAATRLLTVYLFAS